MVGRREAHAGGVEATAGEGADSYGGHVLSFPLLCSDVFVFRRLGLLMAGVVMEGDHGIALCGTSKAEFRLMLGPERRSTA